MASLYTHQDEKYFKDMGAYVAFLCGGNSYWLVFQLRPW